MNDPGRELSPIDEDAVTDEERLAWDVPTPEQSRARVAQMNPGD